MHLVTGKLNAKNSAMNCEIWQYVRYSDRFLEAGIGMEILKMSFLHDGKRAVVNSI
jgi:hypothetical protein